MASVQGVLGPIEATDLGVTLIHEHLVVDVRQRHTGYPDDRAAIVAPMLDDMRRLRDLGVRTLVDCTPTHLGRDLNAYREVARATGLQVIAAHGTYRDAWLLDEIRAMSVRALADWYAAGLDEAGFIKLGCDPDGPSEAEARCAEAAGRASDRTGAMVACHLGRAAPAWRILDAFERGSGDPARFVVVHLQNEINSLTQIALARRGAWVEFDAIGAAPTDAEYVAMIRNLADAGFLDRVLISQDACAYILGDDGSASRQHRFAYLNETFLPLLRASGFAAGEVRRLMVENPARALTGAL